MSVTAWRREPRPLGGRSSLGKGVSGRFQVGFPPGMTCRFLFVCLGDVERCDVKESENRKGSESGGGGGGHESITLERR